MPYLIKSLIVASICLFCGTTFSAELDLNEKEKAWLNSHSEIRLGAITGWPPYNFYDSNGAFTGISSEIIKRIEINTGLKFKYIKGDWDDLRLQIKEHKIDILSAVYYTPERAGYMLFTRPFSELHDYIFTRKDRNDIKEIKSIRRIAIVKGFSQGEIIKEKYPNIEITWYNSMQLALEGVIAGHADAYIGSIASVSYLISSKQLMELKVAAPTGWNPVDVSMAVNTEHPELLGILNKAINTIGEQEVNKINRQWFALEHEAFINLKQLWISLVIGLVLFAITSIWLISLRREVKARKKAEEHSHQREQNLTVTLNSIGDAVIATDKKGNVTNMNPIAENLTGWSLQEAQGQPLKTIFPIVNASTREPIENPVDKVIATGETIYMSNHTTLLARDGAQYQIADSAAPIRNSDNSILGMVLVFNDVTEAYHLREQAQSVQLQLQRLLDDMQTMVAIFECDGTLTFVNNTPLKVAAIELSDVLGKKLWDCPWFIYDPDVQEIIQKDMYEARSGKNVLRDIQAMMAGELLWIEFSIHPVFNEEGVVIQLVAEGRDVSKRLEKEEQLRRSQKMDALGKLTGGIAHDYNNMLGVVLGYSELIEEMVSEQPKLTEYINHIKHAGERGAKLTKKLLTFSRQQSSENKIVNLNTLLEGSQLMLEKTLTVRISLVYELEKNCWPINIDESELEDAILNMSINAMHAIEGTGQLTFETRNETIKEIDAQYLEIPAGDYVLLSIADTGCGMDNKTKENIFDPFFSTKGELGTGLGLSQVYGFAQRSKGNITILSELGHGSLFTLYFPRYYESELEEKQFKEEDETNLSGNQIILVVDDEPALATLISHFLTQQGYHVFTANSAKEALLILEKEAIDVLLSDVIMPEMDGYQLASIVQEKYPNIKIQLASGFNDDRHAGNINASLHENLLHKPYHSKKLLLRIRELLKGSAD